MALVNSRCVVVLRSLCGRCFRRLHPAAINVPVNVKVPVHRQIYTSAHRLREEQYKKTEKELILRSETMFDDAAQKVRNKMTFRKAVGTFLEREGTYRRGHVEFIYSALKRMKEFGVEKDLEVYKQILEILPPYIMIPRSIWQIEFQHYPKQQQCAIDLMEQMESYGVIPDNEFGDIILSRFGKDAHASRKFRRILYWLPKFKHMNPYPIPRELPDDHILLAMIALKRMAIDLENKIFVHKTTEMEDLPSEDTFIAYAISPKQRELIASHPVSKPVYVEGGYNVWLRHKLQTYFVLIADADPEKFEEVDEEEEELFEWKTMFEEERPKGMIPALSVHEQEDGTVLSMCITGTATKDSLVTWIRYLQLTNPKLEQIPVVFRLRTPESGLQLQEGNTQNELMRT